MLNILSKKMKRQLLLLELLFEGETYRFQDLESQLKCSSKTLRNDLMDIDSYAKEINIHTDRENGIFAEIAPLSIIAPSSQKQTQFWENYLNQHPDNPLKIVLLDREDVEKITAIRKKQVINFMVIELAFLIFYVLYF
ncbi:MAG: helix-turn-helix domain-containing protein [Enterococcus hirae]|nr:helix-turn-helix domain-containing protein [Enterococcus hirae]